MAIKPKIIITTSNISSPGLPKIVGESEIIYSDIVTSDVLIGAGAAPYFLPSRPTLSNEDIDAYLDAADGLLIAGADDSVDPRLYGVAKRDGLERVDTTRDKLDISLIQKAFARKMPILGICKGMQLINVALGGTLYQDVDAEHKSSINHNVSAPRRSDTTHKALVNTESRAYGKFFNDRTINLNGGHKQAIRELSDKLHIMASAEDGVVEAIEAKDRPFVIGVQWHAELSVLYEPNSLIFSEFIKACQEFASQK